MMDIATILGLIIGIGLILFGMFDITTQTIPGSFLNYQGIAIVLGGTLAATVINYPLSTLLSLLKVAGKAFRYKKVETDSEIINMLIELSMKARKKGLNALEKELPRIKNNFMRNGLEYAIIEKDLNKLALFLNNEINQMVRRHEYGQKMFENMGTYAPAFGLLGTIMGLILMMTQQNQLSPAAGYAIQMENSTNFLLKGMGLALVTTFYGVLLSNLIFLPIAGKLKNRTEDEIHINEIIAMGIESIHEKEHYIKLEEKLLTFLDKDTKVIIRSTNDK